MGLPRNAGVVKIGGGRGMKVRARRLVYASGAPRGAAAGESRAA